MLKLHERAENLTHKPAAIGQAISSGLTQQLRTLVVLIQRPKKALH